MLVQRIDYEIDNMICTSQNMVNKHNFKQISLKHD